MAFTGVVRKNGYGEEITIRCSENYFEDPFDKHVINVKEKLKGAIKFLNGLDLDSTEGRITSELNNKFSASTLNKFLGKLEVINEIEDLTSYKKLIDLVPLELSINFSDIEGLHDAILSLLEYLKEN